MLCKALRIAPLEGGASPLALVALCGGRVTGPSVERQLALVVSQKSEWRDDQSVRRYGRSIAVFHCFAPGVSVGALKS